MDREPWGNADPALQLQMSQHHSQGPKPEISNPRGGLYARKAPTISPLQFLEPNQCLCPVNALGWSSPCCAWARCAHSHAGGQQCNLHLLHPKVGPWGLFVPACFSYPALAVFERKHVFPGVLKNKITQAFTNFSYVSSALVAGRSTIRCLRSQWHSGGFKVSSMELALLPKADCFPT